VTENVGFSTLRNAKGKDFPVHPMKTYTGGVEAQHHVFRTSALDGGEYFLSQY